MPSPALVRAGKPVTTAAVELGISAGALHKWARQDHIDRGERNGLRSPEIAELTSAKKRIRQLEAEVGILRQASHLLGEDRPHPKGSSR